MSGVVNPNKQGKQKRPFLTWLKWLLLEPVPSIQDATAKRQAQLLSPLLLTLMPFISTWAFFIRQQPTTLANMVLTVAIPLLIGNI